MESKVFIKVEPETHNDDMQQAHTSTYGCGEDKKKIEIEIHIKQEPVIKEEPISDEECSELIDYTQVCDSTSQSSAGVAMHIKEEPAANMGYYDEPAHLPVTQLMQAHTSDPSLYPVRLKEEVKDNVDRLEVSSHESVHKQQVIPSGLSTIDVSDSGNSDCTRQVNVKEHSKTNASGNTYQCEMCNKTFPHPSYLKAHIRSHTGEKPYKCNECDKTFALPCNLKTHIRTHTGEKPYKCNICEKSFTGSSYLHVHMRTHTGDNPYKCDTCEMPFAKLGSLKRHMTYHTGNKPFVCEVCNKSFMVKYDLRRHSIIHTGEKPYKCNICEKSFSQLGYLHLHTRTHTGDRPHKCDKCERSFNQLNRLKHHIGKAHPDPLQINMNKIVETCVTVYKNIPPYS